MSNTNTTTTASEAININNMLTGLRTLAGIVSNKCTLPELRENFLEELSNNNIPTDEQYRLITEFDEAAAICRGDEPAQTAGDMVEDAGDELLRQMAIDMAIDELARAYGSTCYKEVVEPAENAWGSTASNPVDGKMFIPGTGVVLNREETLAVLQQARDKANCDEPCGEAAVTSAIRIMGTLASYS